MANTENVLKNFELASAAQIVTRIGIKPTGDIFGLTPVDVRLFFKTRRP